jgi:glycosyltransferase involved in cell wall biosynthesis
VRIVVDGAPAVGAGPTGVGTYVLNLLHRLPIVDPTTEYVAWYVHFRSLFRRRRPFADAGVVERRIVLPSRLVDRTARFGFPLIELFSPCDLVFGTNFILPPSSKTTSVVTVHDLAFALYPETAPEVAGWWRRAVAASVRKAARVLVPSRATRTDLLNVYDVDPDRVVEVPLGVDRAVFSPVSANRIEDVRARLGIEGQYLLFLGCHPRKNLDGMLRALATVPDEVRPRLVVTGSAPRTRDRSDDPRSAIAAHPHHIRRKVSFIGHVSQNDVAALLSGSVGLAFPTLYEGFGFPALEAMACGTPVLTSNTSSLPELVGNAAVLVDPRDDASIAAGLLRIVTDEPLRDRLRALGLERAALYDWDVTARATSTVLHAAAR